MHRYRNRPRREVHLLRCWVWRVSLKRAASGNTPDFFFFLILHSSHSYVVITPPSPGFTLSFTIGSCSEMTHLSAAFPLFSSEVVKTPASEGGAVERELLDSIDL